ncbi:MAG: putative FAD-linked oxidoreductase [Alphaproteobacteria bacterium MarineAlpha2_Bin1]|nr:MAG: putative FAD-linked oxidoreductase [Alphaproteobacteria bacterium MarineAlpha2_Bin1]|tara:strand:+ start:727 stop:2157 length:1431 start_codon:yes stop_codon:yes gene_type:complete
MKKIRSFISRKDIENLKSICGKNGWTDKKDVNEKYLTEERNFYKSYSPIILKPNSTQKISNILNYCYNKNIPIVPQGGNTGLVGGTVSGYVSNEIILNLEKMNKVRELSHTDSMLTVEAGVKLHQVQSIAKSIDKFFPLSLASEGTCQIGGNLATNAGGVHVIKYGNARDLALGLEVVLADGTIINGLKKLRKDNSGYNLNQLFIGSEGTLGIITAASLKLFPIPYEINTILLAIDSLEKAIEIMNELKKLYIEKLSALEFFSNFALEIVIKNIPDSLQPFEKYYPWYILIDIEGTKEKDKNYNLIENFLFKNLRNNIIKDGIVAKNLKEKENFWKIRESIPYAQKPEGSSIKHDISIPISKISQFIDESTKKIFKVIPNIRPCIFGHLGDGNIHFNLTKPINMQNLDFEKYQDRINKIIFDIVFKYNGSISAEHGIGLLKKDVIKNYKDKAEINLMKNIKKIFDKKNILNPGKLI